MLSRSERHVLLSGAVVALGLLATPASAATLRVATWNLGWHVSQAELGPWIAQCGKSYAKDAASGTWKVVSRKAGPRPSRSAM